MTERKWRIIDAVSRHEFYRKVEKYENKGYKLLPESFAVNTRSNFHHYHALMAKI